ncbi:zf-ZPR1-domain-containing protein [Fistulina hepatica ATCC 64428]|uniref:Zf-ZPR1-domain-containing protein n=1 Tax=Fistulina hepatica ATCC 64428 TaxID=1128425 RepID=A0A0D7A212_9AGAR|nr:zf-ZPR1-domain-containing protein [Fistulina hepatica ATCC 64428]
MTGTANNNFFPSIGVVAESTNATNITDEHEQATQEIESLCMKCHEQGVTRILLTSIPFFREVIVMSFRCNHCGWSNNEIQSAGSIKPEGTIYTARVLDRADLNRQVVRSATCEISVPEYQLMLPASGRGQLTTIEGFIRDVVADLSMDQHLRRIQDPDGYARLQELIDKLKLILGDEDEDDAEASVGQAHTKDAPMPPFTLKLDDPAGNSFIEFLGDMSDPKWNMRTYPRTLQQNVDLGLISADDAQAAAASAATQIKQVTDSSVPILNEEIFIFPGTCSSCGHPTNTLMKRLNIPHFKDVLIMSTNCELCGYRDNEVKSGSAISEKGKRITLKVEDSEDLSRDILKSETAGLTIPEIDLVLQQGTLGGRFTTLEGILDQVHEELSEKLFTDSADAEGKTKFETFLRNLKSLKNAERPFTLILDDPLANSYVQNLYAPDPDPNMTVEIYERTWEQNEALGLNDMKVEGYEAPEEEKIEAIDFRPI